MPDPRDFLPNPPWKGPPVPRGLGRGSSSIHPLKITSEYLAKIKKLLSSDQVLIEDLSRVVDKLSKGENISNLEWRNLISETEKLAPHMYSKVNGRDFVQRVWAIIRNE